MRILHTSLVLLIGCGSAIVRVQPDSIAQVGRLVYTSTDIALNGSRWNDQTTTAATGPHPITRGKFIGALIVASKHHYAYLHLL